MAGVPKTIRISLIQMKVGMDKEVNLDHAVDLIRRTVARDQPRVVALPECFNSPYSSKHFKDYAETIPDGPSSRRLSAIAKETNVYIIGGTIPERDDLTNTIHNTCTIWSPTGEFLSKYRKIHLFDMDVRGGEFGERCQFRESDVFTPGNSLTILNVDGFKIGICICYDIRYEELGRIYRNNGVDMLIYPAAFDLTTGPMHWESLQRGRANDLQIFVATVSAARVVDADYVAYGHSMIVNPWGQVVVAAQEGEETIVCDLDVQLVQQVRKQIPISKQRRIDLCETISKFKGEPKMVK